VREASRTARLDLAARGRAVLVDGAADAVADPAPQREATTPGVELQVRSAARTVHDETPDEFGLGEQRIAGDDLDVVDETFGPILVGIGAARSAARAIENRGATSNHAAKPASAVRLRRVAVRLGASPVEVAAAIQADGARPARQPGVPAPGPCAATSRSEAGQAPGEGAR
jgi:hypothetical protein